MKRTSVVVVLCLALSAPLVAQDAAAKTPDEICARVANFSPGPKARPTEEDRRLVASGSLRQTVVLQYGDEAKEEREYDETRRYCLVKGDCDVELAMIFANGWGVPRDFDAAIWLDELATALDAFASADAGVQTCWALGNVVYALREVEEGERIRKEQVSTLERLASERAPGCTPEALEASDAALNESYRLARAVPPESPHRDTSGHEAEWAATLRDAQRAWIRYRDAWAAFYLARWKGKAKAEALKREIACEMTSGRSAQLDRIHDGGPGE